MLLVLTVAWYITADCKQFPCRGNETTLFPSIANLGSIEYEAKDAATREATMLALNFAIVALENARSTLAVSQRLAL